MCYQYSIISNIASPIPDLKRLFNKDITPRTRLNACDNKVWHEAMKDDPPVRTKLMDTRDDRISSHITGRNLIDVH